MIRYFLVLCCIIITACNSKETADKKVDSIISSEDTTSITTHHQPKEDVKLTYLDSVRRNILANAQSSSETIIYPFSLEGSFSAEGNEGKAFYVNNVVNKIEITFFGETGKAFYSYQFQNDTINVVQQRFNYRTNLKEVKSEKDIVKGERIAFTTDLQGKLISGTNSEADLTTFFELKKVVPFSLK